MFGKVLAAHPAIACRTEYLNRVRYESTEEKVRVLREFYEHPPILPPVADGAFGQTMNPFKYDLDALDIASAFGPAWLGRRALRVITPIRRLPIRVVLLERRNALKQVISHQSVRQRGSYVSNRAKLDDTEGLAGQEFDVATLERQVLAARNRAKRLRTIYRRLRAPRLMVTLEEVQADPAATFDAVFAFLGVPAAPAGFDYTAGYAKVLSDDLRDVVANYDELERSPVLAPYLRAAATPVAA